MFFRGQPQTTTTVHIHQPPPQQVQTGQPTAGQPVVCVQPVMGQPVVGGGYGHNNGYGVQSFSVVAPVVRRNQASVSCCGHTTVWTMLSIGILMLVTGSILTGIFSNQDVRNDRITAYNEYVEKWGAFIEEEKYSEPEFSVLSGLYCKPNYTTSDFKLVGQERRITLKLETDKTDELEDSKGGSPKPLPLEPQHKWQKDSTVQDATAELCYLHDDFQWRDSSTNHYTDIYTVKSRFKETRSYKCDDCAHKCYNKNFGYVYSGRCYYPMVIDGICLKVKRTYDTVGGALSYESDTSEPAVGNEGESQGCFYSRNSKSFRPHHFNNEPEPVHSQDFKIQYTVRYSKDAWLGYMRVTENSGYFGDTNKGGFIAGIFFLCAGIPLFVSSLVVFWLTLKKVDRFNKMSPEARQNLRSSCMIVIW